jgi:holdfast attachment protein HfaA
MAYSKKILVIALAAAAFAGGAQAGDYTNSASYNGFAASQNTASDASLRDANNNLTLINGQFASANFGVQSGVQRASTSTSGGVGMSGATSTYGTATAIGNSLNVVTVGNNNTVVVNSNQTNNGNQTASTNLNGH